jgi:hypothetical protein
MSKGAFKKIGIGPLDDPKFTPTKGVLINPTPEVYHHIRSELEPILAKLGDEGNWRTGSSGSWHPQHRYANKGTTKTESGDIDVFLDADAIKQAQGLEHETELSAVKQLVADTFNQQFIIVKAAEVHLAFPADQKLQGLPVYYQVDFFVRHHAHKIAAHHEHDYSIKGTPYKGVDQQLAMSSLVNTIPGAPERTYQYNGMGGALQDRATGKVITHDLDELVKMLGIPGLTSDDVGNVESILAKVPGGINSSRLAQFRADMDKKYPHLKEGTADWFANLRSRLNIV